MQIIRWVERPSLRRPIMIAAFEGWNDAGDAASSAVAFLAQTWNARAFAGVDPEEFFDFTATRPHVRLVDGMDRTIDWPTNDFASAPLPNLDRDVILLHGVEPQLRWRTFSTAIAEVTTALGVELVITLGALLAEVPHTRPVRVTGTAGDASLVARLALQPSRYEGPTGIVGVLHQSLSEAGVPSASLWATVPHYVGQTPSPKATLALIERTAEVIGVPVLTTELDIASAAYERQVTEVVEADDDATAYVRSLEEAEDDSQEPLRPAGADALAAEVERFLRDHGQG